MYSLRSHKKKEESGETVSITNPKLVLPRIPILDDTRNHGSTFTMKNGAVSIMRKRDILHKPAFILVTITLLIVLAAALLKGQSNPQISNAIAPLLQQSPHYVRNLYDQVVTIMSQAYSEIIVRKNETCVKVSDSGKKKTRRRRVKKVDVCYNDIRDYVEEYVSDVRAKAVVPEGRLSFIQEQCRIVAEVPKIADNLKEPSDANFNVDRLVDYASYSKGARILSTPSAVPSIEHKITLGWLQYLPGAGSINVDDFSNSICWFSNSLCQYITSGPALILQPSKKAGDCWTFKGTRGSVQIELTDRIYITSVTVEHISKELTSPTDLLSAPRKFSLVGIDDSTGYRFTSRYYLGTYEYRLVSPNVQTFTVTNENGLSRPYKVLEFNVESNHGNDNYTCVYRLRVHGRV